MDAEPFRRDSFARPVAELTGTGPAPYLITTRIDSDDAMAVDFMAAVQAQFGRQERLFVNFTRGVQIDRTGAVYRSDVLSNPFVSLIERRDHTRPPDTVISWRSGGSERGCPGPEPAGRRQELEKP